MSAGRRYLVLALASIAKLRGKKYQWYSHRYKLLLWPGKLKPQWTLNTDCAPAINCCAWGNWSIKIEACSTTAILVFLLLRKYHHKVFELKFRSKRKGCFFFQINFLEQILCKYQNKSRVLFQNVNCGKEKLYVSFYTAEGGKKIASKKIIHDHHLEIITCILNIHIQVCPEISYHIYISTVTCSVLTYIHLVSQGWRQKSPPKRLQFLNAFFSRTAAWCEWFGLNVYRSGATVGCTVPPKQLRDLPPYILAEAKHPTCLLNF